MTPPPGLQKLVRMHIPDATGDGLPSWSLTPCWLWQGRVDERGRGAGYGRIGRAGRAHVVVYTLLVGPVAPGLQLDHRCRQRACVNPLHLDPVTPSENARRRRRTHCAAGHALTDDNVEPSGRRARNGQRGRCCRKCRAKRRAEARAAGRNA